MLKISLTTFLTISTEPGYFLNFLIGIVIFEPQTFLKGFLAFWQIWGSLSYKMVSYKKKKVYIAYKIWTMMVLRLFLCFWNLSLAILIKIKSVWQSLPLKNIYKCSYFNVETHCWSILYNYTVLENSRLNKMCVFSGMCRL